MSNSNVSSSNVSSTNASSQTRRPARLRRVELSVPGSSPKMMAKAGALRPDVVILDLEDSVVAAQKVAARAMVAEALNTVDFGNSVRAVRINAPGTPYAHGDLIELMESAGERIDTLIIPKASSPRDVWYVDTLLSELETKLGLTNRVGLELLIEDAPGLSRVEEIAACCDRTEALILGYGDLAASMGMRIEDTSSSQAATSTSQGTGDGGPASNTGPALDVWHAARTRVVAAARANGLDPIEGPYLDFGNPEGLRRAAQLAATMGCAGKWAIHPNQIEILQTVFAPTEEELATARAAIDAMDRAEAAGIGAAGFEGRMLDAATSRIYREVLERAARIQALSGQ